MQEILCVLDKSGSMSDVAKDAVGGFNQFLKEQKKIGEANISIVFFDNNWELFYSGPLSQCDPLAFWPIKGSTALYDAIGKTIDYTRERYTNEKPEKVILAILTDGIENASKTYTQDMIASLIKEHQDKYRWEVIFLAADQDAWATARHLNIKQDKSFSFAKGVTGQSIATTYSTAVSKSRAS